tara:strand:+ start:9592 stop:10389 length:798 start_codon:yes stop_codon:yes gene_type:complete
MSKNVLFWIGVKSKDSLMQEKHGEFKYLDVGRKSWEWWCKKNDVIFLPYEQATEKDTGKHRVTWTRWFDVLDRVKSENIDYNKIAVIDGSTIVRWDTPNFFDLTKDGLTAFRSLENIRWICEGVGGYNNFFKGFNFDISKYISCGFQIFDKSHEDFLGMLKKFYYDNNEEILKLQTKEVTRGTDQPVYNYLLQIHNIKVNMDLPKSFMLTHLQRFDWLSHNWQLDDQTPFFIRYGYIWFYSGFAQRGHRYDLMKQTWDTIKGNYK